MKEQYESIEKPTAETAMEFSLSVQALQEKMVAEGLMDKNTIGADIMVLPKGYAEAEKMKGAWMQSPRY